MGVYASVFVAIQTFIYVFDLRCAPTWELYVV